MTLGSGSDAKHPTAHPGIWERLEQGLSFHGATKRHAAPPKRSRVCNNITVQHNIPHRHGAEEGTTAGGGGAAKCDTMRFGAEF